MLSRRLFVAMTAMAAAIGFGSIAQADALGDITARGTIRVAVPQDFPPFGSVGPTWRPSAMTSTWRT